MKITGEGDEGTTADPDKVITNARHALPADGLLSTPELMALFSSQRPLRSAYDEGQRKHRAINTDLPTFGDRVVIQSHRHGAHEPAWTSYTHYWKTVLGKLLITRSAVMAPDLVKTTYSS
jgi:RNA exonuclease NGL2